LTRCGDAPQSETPFEHALKLPNHMAGPEVKSEFDFATESFGSEWAVFDQTDLPKQEMLRLFESYFGIFHLVPPLASTWAADLGRWTKLVAPHRPKRSRSLAACWRGVLPSWGRAREPRFVAVCRYRAPFLLLLSG
jgi:hypothetical protein